MVSLRAPPPLSQVDPAPPQPPADQRRRQVEDGRDSTSAADRKREADQADRERERDSLLQESEGPLEKRSPALARLVSTLDNSVSMQKVLETENEQLRRTLSSASTSEFSVEGSDPSSWPSDPDASELPGPRKSSVRESDKAGEQMASQLSFGALSNTGNVVHPRKDPVFKMESCTVHVHGIPDDPGCDEHWLCADLLFVRRSVQRSDRLFVRILCSIPCGEIASDHPA